MGFDQPWHWLVVIALFAVLFGYKRLPDASRSLGRSLRIFKSEIKGLGEDDKARDAAAAAATPAVVVAPVAPAPAPAPEAAAVTANTEAPAQPAE
jgi:sec-independent protein translocase protein TatA